MTEPTDETPSADSELARSQPSVEALALAVNITGQWPHPWTYADRQIRERELAIAIDAHTRSELDKNYNLYMTSLSSSEDARRKLNDRVAELEARNRELSNDLASERGGI